MNPNTKRKLVIGWIVLSIMVLVMVIAYHLGLQTTGRTIEKRGQFGDQFGALNALFTGWAFIGVIISILIQQAELQATNQEMAATSEANRQQVAASLLATSISSGLEIIRYRQAEIDRIQDRLNAINQRMNTPGFAAHKSDLPDERTRLEAEQAALRSIIESIERDFIANQEELRRRRDEITA